MPIFCKSKMLAVFILVLVVRKLSRIGNRSASRIDQRARLRAPRANDHPLLSRDETDVGTRQRPDKFKQKTSIVK